jgi:hypothetical protein
MDYLVNAIIVQVVYPRIDLIDFPSERFRVEITFCIFFRKKLIESRVETSNDLTGFIVHFGQHKLGENW